MLLMVSVQELGLFLLIFHDTLEFTIFTLTDLSHTHRQQRFLTSCRNTKRGIVTNSKDLKQLRHTIVRDAGHFVVHI